MNRMQNLNSSSDEEEVLMDREENEEPIVPRKRLDKKSISATELVDEDKDLDDFMVSTVNYNDKVEKKRQRKKKDESGLKKKKQDLVLDLENSKEIDEMWDSLTNNNNSKDSDDNVVANSPNKDDDDDDEIDRLFKMGKKKKSKEKKNKMEIAMQVEEVMAKLEIAVEDDIELNKEGKPAINKLMKLPFLNEALSKKHLQAEFLDHGVLNILKNWLEPLPDGSLPNINIRTAILKILTDLSINLDKDSRREQFIKSGLGKVIMFLSKSDEETTPNKRLASELVNKWGRIIYNKSTRYENMYTEEEQEEHKQILLRREIKTVPKVSKTKAKDFDIDVDFSGKPKSKLVPSRKVERAKIPQAMSMDFVIRPNSKIDSKLEARVKMQMDNSYIHDNINMKMQKLKARRRTSMQATKLSADGRTMLKYF